MPIKFRKENDEVFLVLSVFSKEKTVYRTANDRKTDKIKKTNLGF